MERKPSGLRVRRGSPTLDSDDDLEEEEQDDLWQQKQDKDMVKLPQSPSTRRKLQEKERVRKDSITSPADIWKEELRHENDTNRSNKVQTELDHLSIGMRPSSAPSLSDSPPVTPIPKFQPRSRSGSVKVRTSSPLTKGRKPLSTTVHTKHFRGSLLHQKDLLHSSVSDDEMQTASQHRKPLSGHVMSTAVPSFFDYSNIPMSPSSPSSNSSSPLHHKPTA